MISEHYSQVIDRLKFPFAVLVVMLHAYTTVNVPDTGFGWNVAYLFSFIFGEMGVPCFFFISGLLFFRNIDRPDFSFATNVKKRIHSLLVPYLLWNTLMIAFYVVGQNIGSINGFFSGVIPNVSQMSLPDFLRLYWDRGDFAYGNSMPVLTPLWYVRNLFVISLLSPIIYFLLKYTKGAVLLLFLYLWLTNDSVAFNYVTLLFFSVGAWCSMRQVGFLDIKPSAKNVIIAAFIVTGLLDLYFHTLSTWHYKLIIHRLAVILGIYATILLVSQHLSTIVKIRPKSLAQYSFFLYLVHYPIMLALRKAEVRYFADADTAIQLGLYFSSVIIVVFISVLLCQLLDRYAPRNVLALLVNRVPNRK